MRNLTTKDNIDYIFDSELKTTVNRITYNNTPCYLKLISKVERWFLKRFYNLTDTERIVRFYVYNDEKGKEFEFDCPSYIHDLFSTFYEEFANASEEIGEKLLNTYGVVGRYYYDVKISLIYFYNGEDTEYTPSYFWKILETDNPRCSLGTPYVRKDCCYLSDLDSKLNIEGYSLNGKYKRFVDVLSDLINKTVIVHSRKDSKALLRILKFLGVKKIKTGKTSYYNVPNLRNFFSKKYFGYKVNKTEDGLFVELISKNNLSTSPNEVMDIDEFIVRRSIKAKLRDLGGK